jgi:hypothetical protein
MVQRARVAGIRELAKGKGGIVEQQRPAPTLKGFAGRFKDTVDPETVAKAAYPYSIRYTATGDF